MIVRLGKKIASHFLVPVGWTLLVIVLLCMPGSAFPRTSFFALANLDKLVHVCLFAVLTGLWLFYLRPRLPFELWKTRVVPVALLAIVLGIVMEFVQKNFVPLRDFDILDIVANSTGASLASLIVWRMEKHQKKIEAV